MEAFGKITTVLGDRDPSWMSGFVLAHEHLRIDLTRDGDAEGFVRDDEAVLEELVDARERFDLGLVVELTCQGMGREAMVLKRLSKKSEVEVVCSTGFYYERFHPSYVESSSVDRLAEMLVEEIQSGIEGTGIRPGVIGEVGSHGEEMSASEEKCFRAAARAALSTGLPVSTHAHLGAGAVEQLDLLQEEGLPTDRVCLGHQDLTDDPAQHKRLAEAGAFVAFDTVGKIAYQPDEVRVRLVLALLDAGYEEKILLSNDISRESYFRSRGGVGYSHLFWSFLPRLRKEGVDEQTIRTMVEGNPKRFLTRSEERRDVG